MNAPQHYYSNRIAVAAWLLLLLPLTVGLGGILLRILACINYPPQWLGWTFGMLFGLLFISFFLMTVWLIRLLFSRSPRLILTDSGITDVTAQVGEITWADIADVHLHPNHRGKNGVCLTLYQANRYRHRLLGWGRVLRLNWLSSDRLVLNLAFITVQPSEILDVIKARTTQNF